MGHLDHEALRQLFPIDLAGQLADLVELGQMAWADPLGDVVPRLQLVGEARQDRPAVVEDLVSDFLIEGGRVFQIGRATELLLKPSRRGFLFARSTRTQ
jgi:hypothetical protein